MSLTTDTETPRNLLSPLSGYLRLNAIIAPHGPIPVSKSTWWNRVRSGEYPKPIKLGPRITAWRKRDIASLLQQLESCEDQTLRKNQKD